MSSSNYWLVVEDHADEFFLIQRAVRRAFQNPPRLHWEQYAIGAQRFLQRKQTPPFLILSDLKMPGRNGFEFFEWLQTESALRKIPFFIISNSGQEEDREQARQLGILAYHMKPSQIEEYIPLLQACHAIAAGRR